MVIEDMTESEAKQLLNEIANRFHIGDKARIAPVIIANVDNAVRRSECLFRIESYHIKSTIDEDGSECEESLLNWGDDPDVYIDKYLEVIRD